MDGFQWGSPPENENAPLADNVGGRRNADEATADRLYHTDQAKYRHETTPTPQQRIHPSRGGYEVVAIDGYGLHLRAWRPYRYLIHELLDQCGGRLTKAAADIVLGGPR